MTQYLPARANAPYERNADLPEFTVTSPDILDGAFAIRHASGIFGVPGGQDESPALTWSGAPEGTKSFAIVCFDPDAPTQAGFWHWAVHNLPADTTGLPTNAGDPEAGLLPQGAITLKNDVNLNRFLGAAPPAGHGPHRYFFTVYALGVESLDLEVDATPTVLAFNVFGTALARGHFMATFELPGQPVESRVN